MCLLFQLVQLDVQFPLETMLEIHVNVIGPHEIVNHVFILFGKPEGKHWNRLKNQSRWILLLSPTGTKFIRFWSKMKRESYFQKKKTVTFPLRRSRYDDVKTLLELFQRFEIAKQNSKSITPTVVAATFFYTPQKFGCVSPSPLKLCQTEDDSCLSKYKSKTCEKNMSSFE